MKRKLLLFGLAALLAAPAFAAPALTPFQMGIWGPKVQIFPEQTKVMGLRLNLARSDNQDVLGLDFGLVSKAERMDAIQLNLANLVGGEFTGVAVGLFNQMGSVAGLQAGLFNNAAHDMTGFQFGLFNVADDAAGFQIGLINRTVSLRGLQIGLVNLNADGPVTFFPFLNASF